MWQGGCNFPLTNDSGQENKDTTQFKIEGINSERKHNAPTQWSQACANAGHPCMLTYGIDVGYAHDSNETARH